VSRDELLPTDDHGGLRQARLDGFKEESKGTVTHPGLRGGDSRIASEPNFRGPS
jgi:hypothetical protein